MPKTQIAARAFALFLAAVVLLLLNNALNPYTKAVDGAAQAGIVAVSAPEVVTYSLDVYEDGSGVLYRNVKGDTPLEIFTVNPDDFMLPWDCTGNGNAECGPDASEEVKGYKCVEFVVAAQSRDLDNDLWLRYCTDGALDWRDATDVDVEGEVL